MPPCDSKHFLLDRIEILDQKSYIINAIWGVKLYLLNESTDTLPQARRHFKRQFKHSIFLSKVTKGFVF